MNVDRCVCCGAIIPEGRQVCLLCELEVEERDFGNTETDRTVDNFCYDDSVD